MAHDAAQRRGPVALHRAVSFEEARRDPSRGMRGRTVSVVTAVNPWSVSTWNAGRSGDPIIESPDALVIDATTHNGIAHLAEFVQRDRDQMLVGIAVA